MNGYSWLYLSQDWHARTRLVNLSEPIDRTLNDGWYSHLMVNELYKGFAKFTDRFGHYYVLGKCDRELKLGQKVSGMVKTEGGAELLRDNLSRIWINTLPEQDLLGPYKSIEQAKTELTKLGRKECKRYLAFYKVQEDEQPVRAAEAGDQPAQDRADHVPWEQAGPA